jgi:hypothetical protein
MDGQKQPPSREKQPALRRPGDAVKDLEPEEGQGENVKGGDFGGCSTQPGKQV